jgi:hypothetical protein
MVVAMAVAGVNEALHDPQVQGALGWLVPTSHQLAAMAGMVAAALALGAVRGPVMAEPFRLVLALEGPARWSASLRRPLIRNWFGAGVAAVAAISTVGVMMTVAGVATWAQVAVWAPGWFGAAAAALAAWLAGQRWPVAGRLAGSLLLALTLALSSSSALGWAERVRWPGGGWPGGGWPGGGLNGPMIVAMAVALVIGLGSAIAAAGPWLMNRLDPSLMRAQAGRWSDATMAARAGYASEAALAYEAWPTRRAASLGERGRRWWSRVIWLDLAGLRRTPGRLGAAILATALGGLWLSLAAKAALVDGPALIWAGVGALACVVCAAGVRGLGSGLRHVVEDAMSPSSYGMTASQLAAAHAVVPVTGSAVGLAVGGCLGGVFVGAPTGAVLVGISVVWLATALVLVCLNTLDRVDRGAPAALYGPMASPMGDPAPILRVAWQVWPQLAAAGWGGLDVWALGALPQPNGPVLLAAVAAAVTVASVRHLSRL